MPHDFFHNLFCDLIKSLIKHLSEWLNILIGPIVLVDGRFDTFLQDNLFDLPQAHNTPASINLSFSLLLRH